jgi:hypothetical protein
MYNKIIFRFLTFITLFSASLALCSCDSSSTANEFVIFNEDEVGNTENISGLRIDPDFQPTVDRFKFEANKRNISVNLSDLNIYYGDTNDSLGVCTVEGSTRIITINPDLEFATDDLLSEIILHELGHCVLGRIHIPDPTSIMHATIIIGEPWRTEVLDELFFGS